MSVLILSIWGCSLPIGWVFPMDAVDVCFEDGYLELEWGRPQPIAYYTGTVRSRWGFALPSIESQSGWSRVNVPLWCPLIVALLPAACLWWTDRRRPLPGHCPCGYDLTGNESGTCPECGIEVEL